MKILQLAYPDSSHIPFKISKFPDGQQSITLDVSIIQFKEKELIKIYSRLNNFRDLELIIAANQALREMGYRKISLYVPYFLGARSDRKFTNGTSNYLKTVICPIINAQKFKTVTVFDPHSDVLEACLNNFKKETNVSLVKFALPKINNKNGAREVVTLVSPDAGALKKVYDVAEAFQIDKIVVASKHRDAKTGKITHTEVPGLDMSQTSTDFVIIDDICDGGRTFIELAKEIKRLRPETEYNDRIFLVVSHGIFSAGLDELSKYFTKIFTTDSIRSPKEFQSLTTKDDFVIVKSIF